MGARRLACVGGAADDGVVELALTQAEFLCHFGDGGLARGSGPLTHGDLFGGVGRVGPWCSRCPGHHDRDLAEHAVRRPFGQVADRAADDLLVCLGELPAHHGGAVLAECLGESRERRGEPARGFEEDQRPLLSRQAGEPAGPLARPARRESLEAEPVAGQAGDGECRGHGRGSRQHADPDTGHAGVRHQQDVAAGQQLGQQPGHPCCLDVVVVRDHAAGQPHAERAGQPAHPAGVLGRHYRRLAERGDQPRRGVLRRADRHRGKRKRPARAAFLSPIRATFWGSIRAAWRVIGRDVTIGADAAVSFTGSFHFVPHANALPRLPWQAMTAYETEPVAAERASRAAALRDQLAPPIPGSPVWGWVGPLLVTVFGAFLRFYRLGVPKAVVFDETYYVGDAYGILRHGVEINHKSNANALLLQGKSDILAKGGELVVHPPLGKVLIAGGEWLFGLTPFGWRFSVAVVGSLSILMTARIARRMTRSTMLGCVAGLLLALDGLELVMSRTALLDIFVMFWVLR